MQNIGQTRPALTTNPVLSSPRRLDVAMIGSRRWRFLLLVLLVWVFVGWHSLGTSGLISRLFSFAPHHNDADILWSQRPDQYPVKALFSVPIKTNNVIIPRIQADPPIEDSRAREVRLSRLKKVKDTFLHCWNGYVAKAWMSDEVSPLSGFPKSTFGGWAATLVDALDTLWIMGLQNDFKRAAAACESIEFKKSTETHINVFETTIRYLGGFLAAYELSGKQYPVLLQKAVEVGDLLMSAFDTPNRMPVSRWNWREYAKGRKQQAPSNVVVSELGSLTVEYTKLSQLTGNMKYYDAVQRISNEFAKSQNQTSLPGMWPVAVDPAALSFKIHDGYTLGGMSDSLYEYLPKQYLMLGGQLQQPKEMYESFMKVATEHVFWRAMNPDNRDIIIPGDVYVRKTQDAPNTMSYVHRGQHLSCFAGGMIGLASRLFDRPHELDLAARITEGCLWSYNATRSGIGAETFNFVPCGRPGDPTPCTWDNGKWRDALLNRLRSSQRTRQGDQDEQVDQAIRDDRLMPGMVAYEDRRYILRPEAIESIFIMYRLTGDKKWMESAWDIFLRIESLTRTKIAAAALRDVTIERPVQTDSMESFWMAETLKYFYLIFSEWDVVSLDEWILNTEAHPLRRPE